MGIGLTQVPTAIAPGIAAACGALVVVHLVAYYRRMTLDRLQRTGVLLLAAVFGLFTIGLLIPAKAGYAGFLGGAVLLFAGYVFARWQWQTNV
jgi:hypothetical protein